MNHFLNTFASICSLSREFCFVFYWMAKNENNSLLKELWPLIGLKPILHIFPNTMVQVPLIPQGPNSVHINSFPILENQWDHTH